VFSLGLKFICEKERLGLRIKNRAAVFN
jgi:hypothetical protein